MKPTYPTKLFAALLFAVFFITAAQAQTEKKCDVAVDKDCPLIENKSAAADTAKVEGKSSENNNLKTGIAAAKTDFKENGVDQSRVKAVATLRAFQPLSRDLNFSSIKEKVVNRDKLTASPSEPAGNQQQTPANDAQELAKKLANPVASLISLPFQSNFDFGMGPNKDGFRYTLNVQPVIPITLNKDWNLISRTIVPIIGQSDVVGTSSQFGLGDTLQSFFFSPSKSEPFIWGIGPQFLIPTGTNKYLGSQKLGIGLTGLILKQKSGWTVGALINHTWSVAGKSTREDVSLTFIQPFISFTTKTAWTFNLNTESTYDWNAKTSNIPIHFVVTKLVRFGKQPVSIGGGLRCWAHSAPGGPRWCGFRLIFTPLFPKK